MSNEISQTWQKTKKYPKGAPTFWVDGKRVSIHEGFKLTVDGKLGDAVYLKQWFRDAGFIDARKLNRQPPPPFPYNQESVL